MKRIVVFIFFIANVAFARVHQKIKDQHSFAHSHSKLRGQDQDVDHLNLARTLYQTKRYNSTTLHIVTIDPVHFHFKVAVANDVESLSNIVTRFEREGDSFKKKVIVAINGGFFKVNSEEKTAACYLKSDGYFLKKTAVDQSKCEAAIGVSFRRNTLYLDQLKFTDHTEEIEFISNPNNIRFWNYAADILQVGPILVNSGKLIDDQKISQHDFLKEEDYALRRDKARSAICRIEHSNKIALVAVESNDGNHGINLIDLANFMYQDLKCAFATNLDGGGSTTLYYNNDVVYYAEKPNQRKINNALLVYATDTIQGRTIEN